MAYDPRNSEIVMFGGQGTNAQPPSPFLGDTWIWNGSNWVNNTPVSGGPAPRVGAAMAYDQATQQLIMFGGLTDSGIVNETWSWDGTNWHNITPDVINPPASRVILPDEYEPGTPPAATDMAMAYDPQSEMIIMFGGAGFASTTWGWDGTNWLRLSENGPAGRFGHGMTYDEHASQLLMFGGVTSEDDNYKNQMWKWQGGAWQEITPASNNPAPRYEMAFAYDGSKQRTILHGGGTPSDTANDTWSWNGSSWEKVVSPSNPRERFTHKMAYDIASSQLVLFGGFGITNSDDYLGDTWTLGALNQNADSIPPILGTVSWINNPKRTTQTATLTAPVSDDISGVAGGEYYLGTTDPGQGSGTAMTLNGLNLTANFGPSTPAGVYQMNVRAKDNAGNWSAPTKTELVVYNPNGLRISGNGSVSPSLANGDVLPGLSLANQADRATFNMNVRYINGVINNTSSFSLTYTTAPLCIVTLNFTNCHTTSINSSSVSWLVVDGQNQSEGIFQGTASVTKDGATTTNPFRITAKDGTRITNATADRLAVSIFAPGANPARAMPLYRLNDVLATGNITIQ